jgi:hypothetical protein
MLSIVQLPQGALTESKARNMKPWIVSEGEIDKGWWSAVFPVVSAAARRMS